MKWRTKALLIALPVIILVGAPVAFLGFWIYVSGGTDAGSPELAKQWRDELSNYGSLHEVKSADPTVEIVEFDSGEWLYGRAQNSHGNWRDGGTVVVRDSSGQTRAFLGGHVCGNGFLREAFDGAPDLKSFYDQIAATGFQEYSFDQ
jgi:hypothetical protein